MSCSNTTKEDFICEQPSLQGQSHTCKWCHQIYQCVDVHFPWQAHPHCDVKEAETEEEYDPYV